MDGDLFQAEHIVRGNLRISMVYRHPEIHGYPWVLEAVWVAASFSRLSVPLRSSPILSDPRQPQKPKCLTYKNSEFLNPGALILGAWISESIPAASKPRILEVLEGSAGLEV